VPRYLRDWARRNRCSAGSVTSRPRRLVVRRRWRGCRAPVEHLRLERTGHGWPGVFVTRPGDPTGVQATREIWRFFSRL
jgi:polyhydroxybutyrate depolymerase